MKVSSLESCKKYTSYDWDKWDNNVKSTKDVTELYKLWESLKNHIRKKSFPKDWSDELILDFFVASLRHWNTIGIEYKYLNEKYFPLFIQAVDNQLKCGIGLSNHFFLFLYEKGNSFDYANITHSDFIMRHTFAEAVNAHQSKFSLLYKKTDKFLPFADNLNLVEHIKYCLKHFKIDSNTFDQGYDALSKRLYYACIYLIILSKDQVGLDIVRQIINTETKRLNKRTEIYHLYDMLQVMRKNNAETLQFIPYLEENYPKNWLKKYEYAPKKEDTIPGNSIYNLKEYKN